MANSTCRAAAFHDLHSGRSFWSDSQMPRLERTFGVNLASGGFLEEVQLGRQLMEEVANC